MSKEEINAQEAIYGFASWLTSRKDPITISSEHGSAEVAALAKKFVEANNLSEVRDRWVDNLIYPK